MPVPNLKAMYPTFVVLFYSGLSLWANQKVDKRGWQSNIGERYDIYKVPHTWCLPFSTHVNPTNPCMAATMTSVTPLWHWVHILYVHIQGSTPRLFLTFFESVHRSRRAKWARARWTRGQFVMQLLECSHWTAGSGLRLGHWCFIVWFY